MASRVINTFVLELKKIFIFFIVLVKCCHLNEDW